MGNPRLVTHGDVCAANTPLWPLAFSLSFVEAALHRACDLFPRLLIVAEISWHGDEGLAWEHLSALIERDTAYLGRVFPSFPQRA